jgi:protein involved in polysaccharide export with SLBB domain
MSQNDFETTCFVNKSFLDFRSACATLRRYRCGMARLWLPTCWVLLSSVTVTVSAYPTNAPDLNSMPSTMDDKVMTSLDDHHKISVGDHLSFQIQEDGDDSKELIVTDSGEIEVPCLGHVSVQGMTCRQLALVIKKQLEAKYYYQATVIISVDLMGSNLGNVYLSGAVHAPGRIIIPGNEMFTVSKAVLCAGGFSDTANQHNVIVTRRAGSDGTNELFTVDVEQVLERGRTDKDLPLKAGDMIFVPEHFNLF